MKNIIKISFLLTVYFSTTVCFAQFDNKLIINEPTKYNDYIVSQQNAIGAEIVSLIEIFRDENSTKEISLSKLNAMLNTTSEAIENLNRLKTLEDDFGLKDNATNLFSFYKRIMGTSYVMLIEEYYSAQPDMEKLEGIMNSVTTEEAVFDEAFQSSQKIFAEANNFELETNELQSELK